ncbi:MAG: CopG family transcriptional regulator [Alphaproteobacteria bacterium]|nr:MAG: CopG family transcriptional regulator [Caulobacteraceae bacterium]TPW07424.1 MAG: CopG family transcriptional regulator [Alphaproteobacteria bacterium]
MARKRITVYLPPDLQARVERIALDQHRSESSVITDAVRARWDRNASNEAQEEPARRQLSRVDARLDKAVGETLILKEIVLLFIRVWLEHNPPIDEALEESAAASAEARFERFLDFVAQGLAPGKSVAPADHALALLSNGGAENGHDEARS